MQAKRIRLTIPCKIQDIQERPSIVAQTQLAARAAAMTSFLHSSIPCIFDSCPKKFASEERLYRHIQTKHETSIFSKVAPAVSHVALAKQKSELASTSPLTEYDRRLQSTTHIRVSHVSNDPTIDSSESVLLPWNGALFFIDYITRDMSPFDPYDPIKGDGQAMWPAIPQWARLR